MFNTGDLVVYNDKFELGKIKRLVSDHNRSQGAFVWYHTGDTAALTHFEQLTLVMNKEEVEKYSIKDLAEVLMALGFNNKYAIESILNKKEENKTYE